MESSPGIDITVSSVTELPAAAAKILLGAGTRRVFLLSGPMGAGKTALIRELCRGLGSSDHFSSPTYAIINEYDSPVGRLCHFDLYRINSVAELYDLGIEEYLASGDYCFFEWPQLLEHVPLPPCVEITIEVHGDVRRISANSK